MVDRQVRPCQRAGIDDGARRGRRRLRPPRPSRLTSSGFGDLVTERGRASGKAGARVAAVMVGELAGNTAACAAPERGNRCTEVDRTGSRKSGVRDLRCQNAPTASSAASPLRTVPSV